MQEWVEDEGGPEVGRATDFGPMARSLRALPGLRGARYWAWIRPRLFRVVANSRDSRVI